MNDKNNVLFEQNGITDLSVLLRGSVPEKKVSDELEELYRQKKLLKSGVMVTDRYPENFVDEEQKNLLESLYQQGELSMVPTTYCIQAIDGRIMSMQGPYDECEYNGVRYVRYVSDKDVQQGLLSNGRFVKKGDVCYLEVKSLNYLLGKESVGMSR